MKAAGLAVALAAWTALPSTDTDAIRIVCYNLYNYSSPTAEDPVKSAASFTQTARLLARLNGDILAVQELQGETAATQLSDSLAAEGCAYSFHTRVTGSDRQRQIGIFARTEPVSISHHATAAYRIRGVTMPVRRGFGHCTFVFGNYRLHVVVAHLKSKFVHPLGQSDMRRYEARQLRYLVDDILHREPGANILVLGDMNDTPDTSPVTTIINRRYKAPKRMYDLRPLDSRGDSWTHYWGAADIYSRFDYAFGSYGLLPEIIRTECRIVDDPGWYVASDHRPIVVGIHPDDAEIAPARLQQFQREIWVPPDNPSPKRSEGSLTGRRKVQR